MVRRNYRRRKYSSLISIRFSRFISKTLTIETRTCHLWRSFLIATPKPHHLLTSIQEIVAIKSLFLSREGHEFVPSRKFRRLYYIGTMLRLLRASSKQGGWGWRNRGKVVSGNFGELPFND